MSDLSEVKGILEAQGVAWEEFKKTNDALIKAKADGKAVADIEAKLETLSKALDAFSETKATIEKTLATLNRPDLGSDKAAGQLEVETKQFNDARRSFATSGHAPEINNTQYAAYKSAYWAWVRKGNMQWLS